MQKNRFKLASDNAESPRLFKNSFLESLTHATLIHLYLIYVPLITYFCYLAVRESGLKGSCMGLLIGVFSWSLFEYFIHRYLFHYRSTNKNILSLIAYSHTIHHDYPRDLKRLIMPPIISVPLAYAFFILFKMVLGSYYQAIYAGFMLGYVMYDSLHYLLHRFNLKNSLFYYLKKNHFHHHFRDNTRCFSVTSPYWDTIMKTRPKH